MSRKCKRPDTRSPEEKAQWEQIRRNLAKQRRALRAEAGRFLFRGRNREVHGIRA
jgi:hypothetical protein